MQLQQFASAAAQCENYFVSIPDVSFEHLLRYCSGINKNYYKLWIGLPADRYLKGSIRDRKSGKVWCVSGVVNKQSVKQLGLAQSLELA